MWYPIVPLGLPIAAASWLVVAARSSNRFRMVIRVSSAIALRASPLSAGTVSASS